jgi:alkylhydroperoxidase family enzyme
MRQAVEEYCARLGGSSSRTDGDIPADLASYLNKVALHAYKTTDEDIAALRQVGYSEDAIFEITLSAALAAGLARLERGLAILKEGQE